MLPRPPRGAGALPGGHRSGSVDVTVSYRNVKSDIRRRITEGAWKPGGLLPSEIDLAARYDCARATVNRAMRELAEEGLVERRRRAGTRVRTAPRRQARFDIPLVRQEIEERGARYRYALLRREAGPAPDWLRARLGLDPGGEALHLVCIHHADGAPYQLEDRWISLATLPQAREADFSETGPNEWLVATVPFSQAEIAFSATAADRDLAAHLDCAVGDALFQTERSTWWEGRAVTTVRLVFRRGHRVTTRC